MAVVIRSRERPEMEKCFSERGDICWFGWHVWGIQCASSALPVRQQTMTAKHYNSEQQSFFLIDKCIHTKTLGLSANCTLVQKCVSVSENVSVIWGKLWFVSFVSTVWLLRNEGTNRFDNWWHACMHLWRATTKQNILLQNFLAQNLLCVFSWGIFGWH